MNGTIESTNGKISRKVTRTRAALEVISDIVTILRDLPVARGKKYTEATAMLNSLHVNLSLDALETIASNYNLAIVSILSDYYARSRRGDTAGRSIDTAGDYYRVITSENFASSINDITMRAKAYVATLQKVIGSNIAPRDVTKGLVRRLEAVTCDITAALNLEIPVVIEKQDYETCCGERMAVAPELSELHCAQCSRIKTIIGTVFRDDQFYPQEGQKTKHGGYDPARHYRIWIERLQALENKSFDPGLLARIEYILCRDGYDRRMLTCEQMRAILKDSKVGGTLLNDHAPLLVRLFGGPTPPTLTFQENCVLSIRFRKVMMLYDLVHPGEGNKPYYPYFIYKIIEHEFRNNADKLRLLSSIHLQSRDTVIKNDITYKQMCALADPEDGLAYVPTNPFGRL